jgi:AbrB family looped-hinge helix DNA binding protein
MRITAKGQVTIPQEIRLRLGLQPETEVEFDVVGNTVRLPTDTWSACSTLPSSGRPSTTAASRPRQPMDDRIVSPGASAGERA